MVFVAVVPAASQGARAVALGSTTKISPARNCSPIKPKPNAWAIFPPPIKATRSICDVSVGASDRFDIYQLPLDLVKDFIRVNARLTQILLPSGTQSGYVHIDVKKVSYSLRHKKWVVSHAFNFHDNLCIT